MFYRVLSLGTVEPFRPDSERLFEDAWKAIMAEDELVCAQTSVRFPSLSKPSTIVVDVSTILCCFKGSLADSFIAHGN